MWRNTLADAKADLRAGWVLAARDVPGAASSKQYRAYPTRQAMASDAVGRSMYVVIPSMDCLVFPYGDIDCPRGEIGDVVTALAARGMLGISIYWSDMGRGRLHWHADSPMMTPRQLRAIGTAPALGGDDVYHSNNLMRLTGSSKKGRPHAVKVVAFSGSDVDPRLQSYTVVDDAPCYESLQRPHREGCRKALACRYCWIAERHHTRSQPVFISRKEGGYAFVCLSAACRMRGSVPMESVLECPVCGAV